jgi:PEP-CTERM motif-containing protein
VAAVAAVAAVALMAAGHAQAGAVIDIEQVGPDVVATGSGSLNLTGASFLYPGFSFGGVEPDLADITVGSPSFATVDIYSVTGPSSFGPGGVAGASSGSGDLFGVVGSNGWLVVPAGYASGASLSATMTFDHRTLSGLGLAPGTYTFTLPDDTITVKIGTSSATPEPSTLVMAGIGAASLAGYGWRRRMTRDAWGHFGADGGR